MADDIGQQLGLAANFARNQPYIAQNAGQDYSTALPPDQETAFQSWVRQNKIPFDSSQPIQDYDMRGFYRALMANDPRAMTAINPNDKQLHYPDYWKTPFHETFSNESQWADPDTAPGWNDKDQLVDPTSGMVVYDDRRKHG